MRQLIFRGIVVEGAHSHALDMLYAMGTLKVLQINLVVELGGFGNINSVVLQNTLANEKMTSLSPDYRLDSGTGIRIGTEDVVDITLPLL